MHTSFDNVLYSMTEIDLAREEVRLIQKQNVRRINLRGNIVAAYCTLHVHIHRLFVVGAVRLLRVDLKCTRCYGNAYQSAVCPPTTRCSRRRPSARLIFARAK